VCNAAGTCNYATGECACDEFRAADSDFGDCGGYNIEISGWTGLERCAGYVDFRTNMVGYYPFELYAHTLSADTHIV